MENLSGIVRSAEMPTKDVLWLDKGVAKYLHNGEWVTISGRIAAPKIDSITVNSSNGNITCTFSGGEITTKAVHTLMDNEIIEGHWDENTFIPNNPDDIFDSDKGFVVLINGDMSYSPRITQNNIFYGVEYDMEDSRSDCTRIGNATLHRTLPIHNACQAVLLNDEGIEVEQLTESDWTVYSSEMLDGTRGQVMIRIPEHWIRGYTHNSIQRFIMSDKPFTDAVHIPTYYRAAYRASINRDTQILASVKNSTAAYRGGNNNAEWDALYKTLLGKAVTNLNRTKFQTAARKRGEHWNIEMYHLYCDLYWMYVIEYANRNCQLAYNAELTSEGYHQGGLGMGTTAMQNWTDFNENNPILPIGITDQFGNGTGVTSYNVPQLEGYTWSTTIPAVRYRGIESPFGDLWNIIHGINIMVDGSDVADPLNRVYICTDPSKLSDTSISDYIYIGNESRENSYIKKIQMGKYGSIIPTEVQPNSNQFFGDYHTTNIQNTSISLRQVLFGGLARDGALAGLGSSHSFYAPGGRDVHCGSRLLYI